MVPRSSFDLLAELLADGDFQHAARTVQALKACGVEFAYVNIFEDQEVYRALPKFANWPTFPQLYVKGELVGGCDITLDLYQSGELQKMLKEAAGTAEAAHP